MSPQPNVKVLKEGIFAKGKFFANNFHLKQIEIIWQQRRIAEFPPDCDIANATFDKNRFYQAVHF